MSKEEPKYWGLEGDEPLSCTDISERLQEYVDGLYPDDKIPETIEMVGFDPMYDLTEESEINDIAERILEQTLEFLDENYSESAENSTEPTEEMKEAAKQFATIMTKEYVSFDCEEVCRKTVRILDYLDENDLES